mmetsp:Transcript_19910/g.45846  ORF Transcript_19910/g.45846 Transcript_19910/m.45846 type:complete len:326 (+) Transcript_19910:28-1005(+)
MSSPPGAVSVEVSPPRANESGVHRNAKYPETLMGLPFPNEPTVNTVWHVFLRTCSKFAQREFLGHRAYLAGGARGEYQWETYGSAKAHVDQIAQGLTGVCGLVSQGQGPSQARVGIYSVNRPEWTKCLLAALSQRIVIVPLYDTLGPNATSYIIDHAELTTVLCEKSKLDNLLKGKGETCCLPPLLLPSCVARQPCSLASVLGHVPTTASACAWPFLFVDAHIPRCVCGSADVAICVHVFLSLSLLLSSLLNRAMPTAGACALPLCLRILDKRRRPWGRSMVSVCFPFQRFALVRAGAPPLCRVPTSLHRYPTVRAWLPGAFPWK